MSRVENDERAGVGHSMRRDLVAWDEQLGFASIGECFPDVVVQALLREAEQLLGRASGRAAGVRGVLNQSQVVRDFVESSPVRGLVEPVLGASARPVRSILFDKSPAANWDVTWHQDTTIAVREREDVPAFGPWSIKDGVPHVQPPADVLAQMLTVRVHLDACGPENGPLLVVPGSHLDGILPTPIDAAACEAKKVACVVGPGGVVLMRTLILHASKKAQQPAHRRVLHVEFAACGLPTPLDWACM